MSDSQNVAIEIFKKFDKDNSGFIDAAELRIMLEDTYKGFDYQVTDQDVTDALHAFDANKDGKISLQEYLDVVQKTSANKG